MIEVGFAYRPLVSWGRACHDMTVLDLVKNKRKRRFSEGEFEFRFDGEVVCMSILALGGKPSSLQYPRPLSPSTK